MMKTIATCVSAIALTVLISATASAQTSVALVIDNDGNHAWWTAQYQCDGSRSTKTKLDSKVKETAREKYPDAKNILVEGSNGCGYLVIIYAEWTGSDGFSKKKYGVGIGKGYDDSLKLAIKNLKAHDRTWTKKNSFDVKQSLMLN